jgi:hypothetical protein
MLKTNYWAVAVCAVVYWLLGAVWYDVLFSKPWMEYERFSEQQLGGFGPVWPYVVTLALNLVIAFALAQICIWRNANTAARGGAMGILLWLGIVGPISFTTYMYEMRPKGLFAINEFYPLVGLFVMGVILGSWKKVA